MQILLRLFHDNCTYSLRRFDRVFVLPYSNNCPSRLLQLLRCIDIALLVPFDFPAPKSAVGLCLSAVNRAAVPKASVYEHGHSGGTKHYVCPSIKSLDGPNINSISKSTSKQLGAKSYFRRRILRFSRQHSI